jgi:flavorubredoxin
VPLADGQVLDLGSHRVRHVDTPHVPHGWDAHVIYEETTGTLLCGDLFSQVGDGPAITTDDVLEGAAFAEDVFGATCLTPGTGSSIRALAELVPSTLAIMHGSSYAGDGAAALHALAADYDARVEAALAAV